MSDSAIATRYRLHRMTGRDPAQRHRASTPLELLFDLTFVVAFGQASDQFAHIVAEGHVVIALQGFVFAMFAVCWAWINFSWFASAYDTDDWFFRVATMVQMIGVLVLALGLPPMFASIEHGEPLDNRMMVAGYVVMRVALLAQWLRAAIQDPARRSTALTYVFFIAVSQVGWVILTFLNTAPAWIGIPFAVVVVLLDVSGPVIAERRGDRRGRGSPWHAHHIAERYSLLAIIALGEGILGTIASVSAIVSTGEWTSEAVLLVVAGTGLTFAMWWVYFTLPSAQILHRRRDRSFGWGYSHVLIFAAITATGAGLHVAAFVIDDQARIGVVGAVLATGIPVLIYIVALFGIYTYLLRSVDAFHGLLICVAAALVVVAGVAASNGLSLGTSLLIVMLAPVTVVVGYEVLGYKHHERALTRALAEPS